MAIFEYDLWDFHENIGNLWWTVLFTFTYMLKKLIIKSKRQWFAFWIILFVINFTKIFIYKKNYSTAFYPPSKDGHHQTVAEFINNIYWNDPWNRLNVFLPKISAIFLLNVWSINRVNIFLWKPSKPVMYAPFFVCVCVFVCVCMCVGVGCGGCPTMW